MINLYKALMRSGEPILGAFLKQRLKKGKENPNRIAERKGITALKRPSGRLGWIHAASVGEAQSALILIERLLNRDKDLHILLTTGTLTSSVLMEKKLPQRAFHQFYPLDHPAWVARFLNHWEPDFILWMESELWPCMLTEIRKRRIPASLVNARLSPDSLRKWRFTRSFAENILKTFQSVLCQTDLDATAFRQLGAVNVHVTDNLKYSATPLLTTPADIELVKNAVDGRPCWVYASTHKGEETLAARVHMHLKETFPNLLTILIPRHPERRADIAATLKSTQLALQLRGETRTPPAAETDIYIADTLGELGLFYRIAPIACIGRSFSDDGGGGHNPIEAAQLDCAVLHGPHVQNLQEIFDQMNDAGAAKKLTDEGALYDELLSLLSTPDLLAKRRAAALDFAKQKEDVIYAVIKHLEPIIGLPPATETTS
ncbi:MAG: 3-deoxy-D-manno-octulosonic acid transferase [Alphaproteobacteria bacterium]|nr:3-deoxy-D-manno-octulosonic acid transferase [Alphaproteobacteria bacterium]